MYVLVGWGIFRVLGAFSGARAHVSGAWEHV